MNVKTTIYLPDELKTAVAREARRSGRSEAEVIRRAIAVAVRAPAPVAGFLDGPAFADQADDLLVGFGEQ